MVKGRSWLVPILLGLRWSRRELQSVMTLPMDALAICFLAKLSCVGHWFKYFIDAASYNLLRRLYCSFALMILEVIIAVSLLLDWREEVELGNREI